MSAFIVNDKTINRILSFISSWNFYENADLKFNFWNRLGYDELTQKEKEGLNNLTNEEEQNLILSKIGFVLKEINTEAVNQRYQEKTKAEPFNFKYEPCNIFQAYNHLRCLTYQMLEGNIPETETYKLLQKIENQMAFQIAGEHNKVKNAEWEAQ